MADATLNAGIHVPHPLGAPAAPALCTPTGGPSHGRAHPAQAAPPLQSERPLSSKVLVRRIADVRHHLEICVQNLKTLEAVTATDSTTDSKELIGVSPVTIRTVAACLSELLKLEWTQPHRDSCLDLCKLLDCPQQPVLRQAILHTIEILETTKSRFKSKELKCLREDLQILLGNSQEFLPGQNL